jgi:hypothetical protein
LFNVRNAIGGALASVPLLAAGDFIAGENKDWAYYAGAAVGYGAVATGWSGATLAFVAAAEVLELTFLRSPEGAEFSVFVDGVEYAVISSYLGTSAWSTFLINLASASPRDILIRNNGADPLSAASFGWLALGQITAQGGSNSISRNGVSTMAATNVVTFGIRDSKGKRSTVPVFFPTTFTVADLQAFVNAFAPNLNSVIEGVIEGASLQLEMTLPGGLRTDPVANSDIEEGGNFAFTTPSRYKHTLRIPALSQALFSGESVTVVGNDLETLLQQMTGGVDNSGTQVIPTNGHAEDLIALAASKKTFRRK